jgi:hypothetical protein
MHNIIVVCKSDPKGCMATVDVISENNFVRYERVGPNQLKVFVLQATHPAYPDRREPVALPVIEIHPHNEHVLRFVVGQQP